MAMVFIIIIMQLFLNMKITVGGGYIKKSLFPNSDCQGSASVVLYYPVGFCTPNAPGQSYPYYSRSYYISNGNIQEEIIHYRTSDCTNTAANPMWTIGGSSNVYMTCQAYAAGESSITLYSSSMSSSSAGGSLLSEYTSSTACQNGDSNYAAVITLMDNMCRRVNYLASPSFSNGKYSPIIDANFVPTIQSTSSPTIRYKIHSKKENIYQNLRCTSILESSVNLTVNIYGNTSVLDSSCAINPINVTTISYPNCALSGNYHVRASCFTNPGTNSQNDKLGLILSIILGILCPSCLFGLCFIYVFRQRASSLSSAGVNLPPDFGPPKPIYTDAVVREQAPFLLSKTPYVQPQTQFERLQVPYGQSQLPYIPFQSQDNAPSQLSYGQPNAPDNSTSQLLSYISQTSFTPSEQSQPRYS